MLLGKKSIFCSPSIVGHFYFKIHFLKIRKVNRNNNHDKKYYFTYSQQHMTIFFPYNKAQNFALQPCRLYLVFFLECLLDLPCTYYLVFVVKLLKQFEIIYYTSFCLLYACDVPNMRGDILTWSLLLILITITNYIFFKSINCFHHFYLKG